MADASVFSLRLPAARVRPLLTQIQLGVLVQIDEYSASARINQYERGKHQPDFNTAERLAQVLSVPTAYFYTRDEFLADFLLDWHALSGAMRKEVAASVKAMLDANSKRTQQVSLRPDPPGPHTQDAQPGTE